MSFNPNYISVAFASELKDGQEQKPKRVIVYVDGIALFSIERNSARLRFLQEKLNKGQGMANPDPQTYYFRRPQ